MPSCIYSFWHGVIPTSYFIFILVTDAVVGLEMTFYEVPEDVGVVKVCAIVYSPNGNIECPIEFPFEVFLSTTEGSAGKQMNII